MILLRIIGTLFVIAAIGLALYLLTIGIIAGKLVHNTLKQYTGCYSIESETGNAAWGKCKGYSNSLKCIECPFCKDKDFCDDDYDGNYYD